MPNIGKITGTIELKDEFTPALKKVSGEMDRVGKKLTSTGKKLTLGLTVPLTALATAIGVVGTSFDTEITKIQTLVGVAEEKVDSWRESILELGPAVARGPNELAKAMFVVTSAGQRGADALKILEQSAKASAVGLGDTTEIARSVTAAMQAYSNVNLSAAEATDTLVATVREGNLEASDLAGSLGRVLGIASQVGVSFQEVGTFIATFTRLGVESTEAVTSLRGTLNVLLKPGQEAQETLDRFGLSAEGLLRQIGEEGLTRTLIGLIKTFEGNTEALVKVIPNVRALSGVLGTAGAQGEDFLKISDSIANSQGILEEAFSTTSETIGFAFDVLKARGEVAFAKLGDAILPIILDRVIPALNSVLDTVDDLVEGFENLSDTGKTVTLTFVGIAAAAGPVLMVLGGMVSAVPFIVNGLRVTGGLLVKTGAQSLLFGKAITTTSTSLATYGMTTASVTTKVGGLIPFFTKAASSAGSLVPAVGKLVSATGLPAIAVAGAAIVGVGIGKALNEAAIAARGEADAVDKAVEKHGLFSAAVSLVPDILGALVNIGKIAIDNFLFMGTVISGLTRQFFDWISSTTIVQTAISLIQAGFELLGPVGKFISEVFDGIVKTAEAAWEGVKSFFGGIGPFIADLQEKIETFGNILFGFQEETTTGFQTATSEQIAAFDEFRAGQEAAIESTGRMAEAAGNLAEEVDKPTKAIIDLSRAQKDLIETLSADTFQAAAKDANDLSIAIENIGLENFTEEGIKKLKEEGERLSKVLGDDLPASLGKLIDGLKTMKLELEFPVGPTKEITDAIAEMRDAMAKTREEIEKSEQALRKLQSTSASSFIFSGDAETQARRLALEIEKLRIEMGGEFPKSIKTSESAIKAISREALLEAIDTSVDYSQVLQDLTNVMHVFGVEAGSSLGIFVSGIGSLTAQIPALLDFRDSVIGSAENMTEAIQGAATAIASGIAAIANATASGSTSQRALGGAMAGAQAGAAFGPWGAGIGAAAGALIGFFRGKGAEDFRKELSEAFETNISAALSEAIRKSGKNAQLFIAEIFGENLALGIAGTADKFAEEVGDLFSVFERGEISEAELFTALKETIPLLIENFEQLGPAGEEEIERILAAAERFGVELEEIDALMQATFAPDTVEEIAEAFGMTNKEVKELGDLLGIKIQTDIQRMAAALGLSVKDFKKLGEAVEEEFGIPMEMIDELLASLGISAEELAEALGVEVAAGTKAVDDEMKNAADETERAAKLAERLALALERAALAAGNINIPDAGSPEGAQHGDIVSSPAIRKVGEVEPEVIAPVRSLFTTLSNQIVDKVANAKTGPSGMAAMPSAMNMNIRNEVFGRVIFEGTKDGTIQVHTNGLVSD